MGVRYVTTRLVFDEEHARHFGDQLGIGRRKRGTVWIYHRIEVHSECLTCRCRNIGDADGDGLAGALGLDDLRGRRFTDLAARIHGRLSAAPDRAAHGAVQRILSFVALGPVAIYQTPEPMMLEPDGQDVLVRQGQQRYLALLLLGVRAVEGYDWTRVERQG